MWQSIEGISCRVELGRHTQGTLTSFLREADEASGSRGGKLVYLARQFIGTRFWFESRMDPVPDDCMRVCLTSFDCITFIYHMLAMAWSRDFGEYVSRLREVRYVTAGARGVSNDPEKGTIFDFACEALLENAVTKGLLADVTAEVAGDSRLLQVRVNLAAVRRPKEHDEHELRVIPRFGERPIGGQFIPSQRLRDVDPARVQPGDIILFTLGSVNLDGSPRNLLVRHAAIALPGASDIHFIHATKDFYWRPDNASKDRAMCTGTFLDDDPRKELTGVGIAGCYAGDEHITCCNGVKYFGYDQAKPRSLYDYAKENFAGVKFLRPRD